MKVMKYAVLVRFLVLIGLHMFECIKSRGVDALVDLPKLFLMAFPAGQGMITFSMSLSTSLRLSYQPH